MRQARCRDNFVCGIRLEVQRPQVQADLTRDGPDLQSIHCSRKSIMAETVCNPAELTQLRDFPEDNDGDTPLRICGEGLSLARCETSLERSDQNMSVQIQHPKQLQLKIGRPLGSI